MLAASSGCLELNICHHTEGEITNTRIKNLTLSMLVYSFIDEFGIVAFYVTKLAVVFFLLANAQRVLNLKNISLQLSFTRTTPRSKLARILKKKRVSDAYWVQLHCVYYF